MRLKQAVVGGVRRILWVVMGTIGIVLLIACANVTNLLLVRAEGRQQEVAVRAALGAGSWRLIRGLLLESVLLALFGGLLGIGVAHAAFCAFSCRSVPSAFRGFTTSPSMRARSPSHYSGH